jgi:hypothetical protein
MSAEHIAYRAVKILARDYPNRARTTPPTSEIAKAMKQAQEELSR